jgi:N-acetylmuramoyl-L-alanine amidase
MLTRPTAPLTPARLIAVARRHRALAVPVVLAALLTGSASGVSLIRVHPGDTLSAIALRYHTTVARLVALNHLPGDGDLIYAGQSLAISGSGGGSGRTVYHTVVPGDTLYGIAQHYHVKAATIARRNHLPRSLVVVLGARLAIPQHGRTASASEPAGSSSVVERDRSILAHRDEPSQDQIDAIIRSTSARWGVDPRLALAISWQESGWNMREVSGVDAIGAMQVLPTTGSFISADVVRRNLDLYDAQDNITAGVALLSLLTHDARSTRQAVAGYYQGLSSVRAHGMFGSTKQYVADVLALRTQYEP